MLVEFLKNWGVQTGIEGLSKEKVYLYFCQSRSYDFEFNDWFVLVCKQVKIYLQTTSFPSKILTYLSFHYISLEVLGLVVEAGRLFLPFLIYVRLSSSSSVVEAVVWSR